MAILTPQEHGILTLNRLIFHVVGPGDESLRTLPEIGDPSAFSEFFLDRLRESDSGNMYRFRNGSVTLGDLEAIDNDEQEFVPRSEAMARRFSDLHTGQTSDGVFMVMQLSAGPARLFALVKYDHEEVVHYVVKQLARRLEVNLEALSDTFVKSKQALQKSAIARMTGENASHLSVVDRSSSGNRNITRYFGEFLEVERLFETDDLTKRLKSALHATAKQHKELMPPERALAIGKTIRESLDRIDAFDLDSRGQLIADVFGALPDDSPIPRTLQRELDKQQMGTESFEIEKTILERPPAGYIRTVEGIEIRYPNDLRDAVEVSRDGRTITIRTERIEVDDDESERRS